MDFARLTGRGVRVAIIDSGVNPAHPHIGAMAGGVHITPRGESSLFLDYLGHGTAVTAAIHEKAPEAALYAVKVFDRSLRTSIDRIARAIEWSLDHGIHVVNLSLGALNPDHRSRFEPLIERAAQAGVILVAAREVQGQLSLPGCLPGVIGVDLDWDCPRDTYRCESTVAGPRLFASGYPRPIPGVPPRRNLHGPSFAVANLTGFAARARQICPAGSPQAVQAILTANARPPAA